MGSKNTPGEYDCYANALPDEPMFILLARDQRAPETVRHWADKRAMDVRAGRKPASDMRMVREARECAAAMRVWRKRNEGAWRK